MTTGVYANFKNNHKEEEDACNKSICLYTTGREQKTLSKTCKCQESIQTGACMLTTEPFLLLTLLCCNNKLFPCLTPFKIPVIVQFYSAVVTIPPHSSTTNLSLLPSFFPSFLFLSATIFLSRANVGSCRTLLVNIWS